jgi:hypothetical protein
MSHRGDFRDKVMGSLKSEQPLGDWYYVAYRNKADGEFCGAAVVQATNYTSATQTALKLIGTWETTSLAEYVEVPKDKLPAAEYRNRKLTKEEVEKLWL